MSERIGAVTVRSIYKVHEMIRNPSIDRPRLVANLIARNLMVPTLSRKPFVDGLTQVFWTCHKNGQHSEAVVTGAVIHYIREAWPVIYGANR